MRKKIFIEPYSKFGSKNWIGFFYVTQRIELISLIWLTEVTLFFVWLSEMNFLKYDSVKWTFFFKYDSKNWFFWQEWLKELNVFFWKKIFIKELIFLRLKGLNFFRCKELNLFFNMTQRIEPFFLNWTQRVELFYWIWLKEFNLFFFLNWTQRVEPFYWVWLKELNFFLNITQRITFGKGSKIVFNDPQNWTNEKKELKELNLFLSMIQRMELFFEYDSKNETIFWIRLNESNPFLNMTQWIEPSLTWLEKCFFKKKKKSKNWNFLSMSQRIVFFFWVWLKELNFWVFFFFFKKNPQRIQLFSKIRYRELNFLPIMTQKFFKIWFEEFHPSFYHDSKTFFLKKKKNSKNSTFFLMTHRLEPFCFYIFSKKKIDSKNWSFFWTMTLKMYFFFEVRMRLTEHFFQYYSQNWFFFLNVTFFVTLNLFFEFDSKNWSSPIRLRGITFSLICLKE